MARDGIPDVPRHHKKPLLARTVKAWEMFWTSEISGLVVDADREALDRLFCLYDTRERMQRTFLEKPFTTGSTGQTVVHPAAKEVAALDERILRLEDRFGITPSARLKLGIVLGAAARSLEEMNRDFDTYEEEDDVDPRSNVIDISGTG